MAQSKSKYHHIIGEAKLSRMYDDFRYPCYTKRYRYDHGSLLGEVHDGNDRNKVSTELLIDGHVEPYSGAARSLQHCDTTTLAELLRGYRLAKAAGLLGEPFPADTSRLEKK